MRPLILAAILAVNDGGPPPAAPDQTAASPEHDWIVVFRASDGSFWRAHLEGDKLLDPSKVQGLEGRDLTDLALSPDGQVLAYTKMGPSGRSTELVDLQTGKTVSLVRSSTGQSAGPVWSTDGLRIAVNVYDGRGWDLALVNRYGGALKRLHISGSGGEFMTPAWVESWGGQLYCIGGGHLRVLRLVDQGVEPFIEKLVPGPFAVAPRKSAVFRAGLHVLFETTRPRPDIPWPAEGLPALGSLTWPRGVVQVQPAGPPDYAAHAPQRLDDKRFLFVGYPLTDENRSLLSKHRFPDWNLYLGNLDDNDVTLVHEHVSEFSVSLRSGDAFLLARLALNADPRSAFTRPDCAASPPARFFFPLGALGDARYKDDFHNRWYSRHLHAMAEPSLSCQEPSAESYRFLWLRTWGHPIAVRIEHTNDRSLLTLTELDGAGGYGPGNIATRASRQLSDKEWRKFSVMLKRADFWAMPTASPDMGYDGASWVMEGRSGDRYHVVDRWSPDTGAFRDLCLLLLKLGGFPGSREGKQRHLY